MRVIVTALCLFLASCGGECDLSDFCLEVYAPQYAEGFEILGAEGRESVLLRSHNPWQGAEGVVTDLFICRGGEKPPQNFAGAVLESEAGRIVCMSSTHIAMLDAAGEVERVVGVSGKSFVSNDYIRTSRVADVGYDGNIDYERLLALDPDIVLLYGVGGASGIEGKLRELEIPFAYIGDYLEESPLGKAEWMVAVGEIAGCRERVEEAFAPIPERYEALKRLVAEAAEAAPRVMLNAPYGDAWFMPSRSSCLVRLIEDAGGCCLYRGDETNRSQPIDLEEAAMLVSQADVWLHVGDIGSLAELKRRLPKFADAECVTRGAVWNCDRRRTPAGGNDYWETGVVQPDVVLNDLITIFHPSLNEPSPLVYYRQLQ